MSYHLTQPPPLRRRSAPQVPYPTYPVPYPTYPLSMAPAAPPASEGMDPALKALVIVVAVVVALYLLDRLTGEEEEAPKPNPGKKMSTRDMARKLYERLEKNGDINETTMRSLAQIGRKR